MLIKRGANPNTTDRTIRNKEKYVKGQTQTRYKSFLSISVRKCHIKYRCCIKGEKLRQNIQTLLYDPNTTNLNRARQQRVT